MVRTGYLSGKRAEAYKNLQSILTLLEERRFAPDTFSFSDEPHHPLYHKQFPSPVYDDHFLTTEGQLLLYFLRENKPAYEFYPGFVSEKLGHNSLCIDFKDVSKAQVAELFEVASAIAQVTRPLFGGLGFPWETETAEAEAFNRMLNTDSLDLFKNGPDSVTIR